MRPALYFNLADALDRRGCVVARTSRDRRLAEFLTEVVAAATQDIEGPFGVLRCRRRPGRKPCTGFVVTSFSAADDIYWFCPRCFDYGVVANWQGTFWDLTGTALDRIIF